MSRHERDAYTPAHKLSDYGLQLDADRIALFFAQSHVPGRVDYVFDGRKTAKQPQGIMLVGPVVHLYRPSADTFDTVARNVVSQPYWQQGLADCLALPEQDVSISMVEVERDRYLAVQITRGIMKSPSLLYLDT